MAWFTEIIMSSQDVISIIIMLHSIRASTSVAVFITGQLESVRVTVFITVVRASTSVIVFIKG